MLSTFNKIVKNINFDCYIGFQIPILLFCPNTVTVQQCEMNPQLEATKKAGVHYSTTSRGFQGVKVMNTCDIRAT